MSHIVMLSYSSSLWPVRLTEDMVKHRKLVQDFLEAVYSSFFLGLSSQRGCPSTVKNFYDRANRSLGCIFQLRCTSRKLFNQENLKRAATFVQFIFGSSDIKISWTKVVARFKGWLASLPADLVTYILIFYKFLNHHEPKNKLLSSKSFEAPFSANLITTF